MLSLSSAFFGNGIAGSVDVGEYGGLWVAERDPVPAVSVEPRGFDGVMTTEHLERLRLAYVQLDALERELGVPQVRGRELVRSSRLQ